MKKFVLITSLLILFLYFLYSNYYHYDPENNCSIKIIPSFMPSNFNTKNIIKLIKYSSPDSYKQLCQHVTTINKNPSCGGFDGGCYEYNKPNTIYIGNDQGNIALAAALVMHETCHAMQGQDKRPFSEQECYKMGNTFLKDVTMYENMPIDKY
ncbi:hypothetical protein ACFL0C_02020 [Patescibacteria group bacterium]